MSIEVAIENTHEYSTIFDLSDIMYQIKRLGAYMRKLTLSALAVSVLLTGCASQYGQTNDPLVLAQRDTLLGTALVADQNGNVGAQVDALEKAEVIGSAKAAEQLGKIYIQGKGVPADREKSFQHYSEAAKLGSVDAKITAAWFNMYAVGTVKNEKAGFDLMKDAAKTDKRAKREMGLMYGNLRLPFMNNDSKGADYLSEAAEEGDADAAYYLSVLSTRMNKTEIAEKSLKNAAQMGQPKAQLQLGREALVAGKAKIAQEEFLKSAKSNDSEAMFELGKGLNDGKFKVSSTTKGITPVMESYAWLLGSSFQKHRQATELLMVVEKELKQDTASKILLGNLITEFQSEIKPWNSY